MTVSHKPKCGGHKRGEGGGFCTQPAGWGTDHPGQGKCKLHGGASPIKTGRYSSIKRDSLRERLDEFAADPDPLNLEPEVALLRAFTTDLIERWDEIYGPDGALLAWHESFREASQTAAPKPRQLPDFSAITTVVDKVGGMVERIHKQRNTAAISLVTFNRVLEQLGAEVVYAVRDIGLDETSSTQLIEAVERRWNSIRLEPGKPSD